MPAAPACNPFCFRQHAAVVGWWCPTSGAARPSRSRIAIRGEIQNLSSTYARANTARNFNTGLGTGRRGLSAEEQSSM